MRTLKTLVTVTAVLLLAACAAPSMPPPGSPLLQPSPECQAANLKSPDPTPATSIPDDVLRQARSGWVTVRYDLAKGRVRNAQVVSSQPLGVYDPYVLKHVQAFAEPTGATVAGCIATTNIKF